MVSALQNKRDESNRSGSRGHSSCNADKIRGDDRIGGIYLLVGRRKNTLDDD